MEWQRFGAAGAGFLPVRACSLYRLHPGGVKPCRRKKQVEAPGLTV
ncbi:hypothetical protein [Gemmiger sp.]|nr:hypothetical protein [Gemmiger sp.]